MFEINEKMINDILSVNNDSIFFPLIIILVVSSILIIFFVNKSMATKNINKKGRTIIISLLIGVMCIYFSQFYLEKSAMQYSLKNKTWYIYEDIVYKKDRLISLGKHSSNRYCVYFENKGKLEMFYNDYVKYEEGERVYLLIVKGKFRKRIHY